MAKQQDKATVREEAPKGFSKGIAGFKAAFDGSASKQPSKRSRRRATATQHSELGEKYIAGVPARIMRPRLVFIACLAALCMFGLLMVYSASSVEALQEKGSTYYFLKRQAFIMAIGIAISAVMISKLVPWAAYKRAYGVFYAAILILLVVVLIVGTGGDEWGAKRWIQLPGFTLQPAELAKPAMVMTMAALFSQYYEDRTISFTELVLYGVILVAFYMGLIYVEPDMGTCLIIFAGIVAMLIICGIPLRILTIGLVVGLAVVALAIVSEPYRLVRLKVLLDPWSDPYGDGFQATLAIMAFASGGWFGRGIGNSTMKYNYLPEAHNDFIFAIIGEELGFVGTLIFVAVFMLMLVAAFKIAMRAPTLHAQLLAAGAASVLGAQFFINVLGIMALIPMTGKPLPFISFGGSAIIASLMLAAIILRVSFESNVETPASQRRAGMAVVGAGTRSRAARASFEAEEDASSGYVGRSTAGTARMRSTRRGNVAPDDTRGLNVLEGGRSRGSRSRESADPSPRSRSRSRSDRPARSTRQNNHDARQSSYELVDLQGSGSDRLRRDGVQTRVDYRNVAQTPRPRRSGDAVRDRSNYRGRGRYDR